MNDDIEQVRRYEIRKTVRCACICAVVVLAAFAVSQLAGCASPEREWRDISIAMEQVK